MKKRVIVGIIIVIMIFMVGQVQPANTFELEFKTFNNKKNEKFDLYILLPKEYIEFAIQQSYLDLNINYEGANTLKKNTIDGINVKKSNVQSELYQEANGAEYIQIRLEEEDGVYTFDLLESYPKMDIKYRIKNITKDYIVHIDNFKIEKGKCEIEYNYAKDVVKQPDKKIIPIGVKLLMVLLVIIVIVGIVARIKGRK